MSIGTKADIPPKRLENYVCLPFPPYKGFLFEPLKQWFHYTLAVYPHSISPLIQTGQWFTRRLKSPKKTSNIAATLDNPNSGVKAVLVKNTVPSFPTHLTKQRKLGLIPNNTKWYEYKYLYYKYFSHYFFIIVTKKYRFSLL